MRRHWALDVTKLDYVPLGAGSHHWRAETVDGEAWFVTADDVTALNTNADFDGLNAAYETAKALRRQGLEFVVAPVQDVVRLGDWALALFPYIQGRGGEYGVAPDEATRVEVARLVGRLHSAPPPDAVRPYEFAIPFRGEVEVAMRPFDRMWKSGPYGEATRELVGASLPRVEAMLRECDALALETAALQDAWVVTHGDAHMGNFVASEHGGLHMVDWDAVRLAPRERDLITVLAGDYSAVLDSYREVAGPIEPRAEALHYFRLRWVVADICVYVRQFRRTHEGTDDDARAFEDLKQYLST